jgi:hypoxanthine phosphoribosyltransferase
LLAAGLFEHNACVDDRLRLLLTAGAIRERVAELGRQIRVDYPEEPGAPPLRLIGVLVGACFFVADLARAIERNVSLDFIGVQSYGDEAVSSREIRLTKDLDSDIRGLDILLVEDIVDSGRTVEHLVRLLGQRGPRSLRVASLLDKPSRRVVDVPLDYAGFAIPNEFVVGYGLDFAGRYRNLPDLYALAVE